MAFKLPRLKNVLSDDSIDDDAKNDLGLSLEKLNLGPRKKLLVLTIGGLLVHRVHRREKISAPKYRRPDVVFGNFQVFKRPFCDEFLKFCFERFEVGLWSSAMEHNMEGVLRNVMGKFRSKLLFVWDQAECTNSGFPSLENNEKPIFLKELKKLWENVHLNRSGQYSSSNTLLIDNEPYKALLNPPNTAIFPPRYKMDSAGDTFLGPKGEFQIFLDSLADSGTVPSYIQEHPFGQPAVTPLHSDWNYYSKIIRRFGKEETDGKNK